MLPSPGLKGTYDDVVWVYVYQDSSGSEEDRRAQRIALRFGVTSWPQLFLADPATWKILAHTGREVDSFCAAVRKTKVERAASLAAHEKTIQAEELAIRLEEQGSRKLALQAIDHEDPVVRNRALSILAREVPRAIVARAEELLAYPSDPFRYEVCKVLARTKARSAARFLDAVARDPQDSLNPNVLRINAVQALGACGDVESVAVVGEFAASGDLYNGLTGVAVDALGAIASRDRRARAAAHRVLVSCYPAPPDPEDERATRIALSLARRVHAALGSPGKFPKNYDEAARQELMRRR